MSNLSKQKRIRVFCLILWGNLAFTFAETLFYSMVLVQFGAKITPLLTVLKGISQSILVFYSLYRDGGTLHRPVLAKCMLLTALMVAVLGFAMGSNFSLLLFLIYLLIAGGMMVLTDTADQVIIHLFAVSEQKNWYHKLYSAFPISTMLSGGLLAACGLLFSSTINIFISAILFFIAVLYSQFFFRKYRHEFLYSNMYAQAGGNHQPVESEGVHEKHAARNKLRDIWQGFSRIRKDYLLLQMLLLSIIILIVYGGFRFVLDSVISQAVPSEHIGLFFGIINIIIGGLAICLKLFWFDRLVYRMSFSRWYVLLSAIFLVGLGSTAVLLLLGYYPLAILIEVTFFYVLGATLSQANPIIANMIYTLIPRPVRPQLRTILRIITSSVLILISSSIISLAVQALPYYVFVSGLTLAGIIYVFYSIFFANRVYGRLAQILAGNDRELQQDAIVMIAEKRGRILLPEMENLYSQSDPETKTLLNNTIEKIR